MAQQPGAAAVPHVHRRVEATRICYSETAAPAGQFAVSVKCFTTRSLEFWRRGDEDPRDVIQQNHNAGGTLTRFPVPDLAALQSAAACRGALRGMLASLPQLRGLRLVEHEWDAVVLGELVPPLVDAACRGRAFPFFFIMKVHLRVGVDEQGLLMACKERLASTGALGEKKECPICLDGLEEESAVELPACEHVFHRRCISMWFSTGTTCPICRDDVLLSALPKLLELSPPRSRLKAQQCPILSGLSFSSRFFKQ